MRWLVSKVDVAPNGFPSDYEITPAREDRVASIFTQRAAAVAKAKELATKNPCVQFAVFEIGEVFETTEPTIIAKKLTDRGELVVSTS
jgi:hypothetical protein